MFKKRPLLALLLAAIGIRALAALFLYCASAYHWPLLQGMQHAEPGFWNWAMDAVATHRYALGILNSWDTGVPYPVFTHGGIDYYVLVAGIYKIFGPHPLAAIAVNVAAAALEVLLIVWIMRKLGFQKQALIAGWLLALWPSAILWSTQVLKDTLCGFFTLGALAACVALWTKKPNHLLGWAALILSVFCATKFRAYLGLALAGSAALVFAPAALWQLAHRNAARALLAIGILATVVLSLSAANRCAYPQRWFIITPESRLAQAEELRIQKLGLRGMPPWITGAVETVLSYADISRMMYVRNGILREGGYSIVYPKATFTTWAEVGQFLPKALNAAWFAPFPEQWTRGESNTGMFKRFSGIEMLFIYALVACAAIGAWKLLLRYRSADGWFLLAFTLVLSLILGLSIPNAGTLFRLRLPMLLPCFMLAALVGLEKQCKKTAR